MGENPLINFHACVKNNFWSNKEEILLKENGKDESIIINQFNSVEYKFNVELYSNNIFNIIKNILNEKIYKNEKIKIYINDISITLPTLLYFTENFYLLDLIIDFFEKKVFISKKEAKEEKEEKEEKEQPNINIPILRLGIFKYWITRNPDYFQNSLTLSNILEYPNLLNDDEKFEYYLSKIFDCIIKKEKNFEEYKSECDKLLNSEKNEEIKEINRKRLKYVYEEALNTFKIDSKNIFYFLLEDPLKKENKTQLNSNFYLTQKLSTIIPSPYIIQFKIDDRELDLIKSSQKDNKLINISFLYYGNKDLKENLFTFCDENKTKIGIKILIFGDLDNKENFSKDILNEKGIKNMIYIYNNNKIKFNENVSEYNKKSYYYYFERFFIEFVHELVFSITTKFEYCSIIKAFNEAKNNFEDKFRRIFDLNTSLKEEDLTQMKASIYDLIKIESTIDDDHFVNEYLNGEEENLNNFRNKNKNIYDIYDEYEYEKNKIKNIYYRPNPFSEGIRETPIRKRKYKSYMKLPGIEDLNPKNFLYFAENEIYGVNKVIISELEEKICNNNKVINIFNNEIVFDLGDELCKYFYMKGNYPNGIYIISQKSLEEKNSLLENLKLNMNRNQDNNKALILLKLIDFNTKENIAKKINDATQNLNKKNNNNINFVVCTKFKLVNDFEDWEYIDYNNILNNSIDLSLI